MAKKRILVVDDDEGVRTLLADILARHDYEPDTAIHGQEALEKLEVRPYDLVITDLRMPVMDGLTLLGEISRRNLRSSVIVASVFADMEHVVQAMRLGAADFIAKPFPSEEAVLVTLAKVEERDHLRRENLRLQAEVEGRYTFANIVAESKKMHAIFNLIGKVADYKTTVLITGESGTGKELIARAIHFQGARRNQALVSVNCGGIPETLLESELFGHVKGAFTDAYRGKRGLFEEASGGTLFLDEIGELPLTLQVKLLRALQEEEIRPLGDTRSIKVDVRIIAATAKNLQEEVAERRFRDDLFYRINVLSIEVPPLRERREDIPLLVQHFIAKYNQRLGLAVTGVSNEYMQRLMAYSWRGNVRELEHVIERSMVLAEGQTLGPDLLSPEILEPGRQLIPATPLPDELSVKKNAKIMEKSLIERALAQTKGNKTQASILLELSLPALLYKIKEYQIG
ncbi:MAG: sigma-54 dependent transcriptional regulator [Thermodesulfobacteriota bacterium]